MSIIINIGRSPDNDIVLEETYISSRHAQLIRDDNGTWFIHDLQSSNGSFVNGIKVAGPTEITKNDLILLGGSLLPWKDIFGKYEPGVPKAGVYKSALYHYLLGLGGAIVLFAVFFLANEYLLTPLQNSNDGTGNDSAKLTVDRKVPENITYDFSCVKFADDSIVNRMANRFDSLHIGFINHLGANVSLQEEIDFGNENHRSLLRGQTILKNPDSRHLENILHLLVAKIPEPRGLPYQVFLIDSKEVNAWTSGGRIYFTTAMLGFTRNDDEIAGILGHEINHNELNHINNMLKAQKLAIQKFGNKRGQLVATINKMLSAPFGKRDEVYCDLKGEDLVIAAGFDPCNVIRLWARMAEKEDKYNPIINFLRSHPYAAKRVDCIEKHVSVNYHITCLEKN